MNPSAVLLIIIAAGAAGTLLAAYGQFYAIVAGLLLAVLGTLLIRAMR